jgi:uracil phosphoribosyltransferase
MEPPMSEYENVHTVDHPLAQHALGQIRDATTPGQIFRAAVAMLTRQLIYAATADLATTSVSICTPLEETQSEALTQLVAPIAILRSGAAMLETAIDTLPDCRAGHFGVYHDKRVGATVEYYLKLPDQVEESRVLLLDPAIGTGKTALATISRLQEFGVTDICFLTLIASAGGVESIAQEFPDVRVYSVAVGDSVGPKGYLLPGMGDFGDRYYGSK